LKRLWQVYESESRPKPQSGVTGATTTKAERRFQRALALREIRKNLAELDADDRPLIRLNPGHLLLHLCIYQQHHYPRRFVYDLEGGGIGSLLRYAEELANQHNTSSHPMETKAAAACLSCVEHLRNVLSGADVWGDRSIVADSITQTDARCLVQLGCLIE